MHFQPEILNLKSAKHNQFPALEIEIILKPERTFSDFSELFWVSETKHA